MIPTSKVLCLVVLLGLVASQQVFAQSQDELRLKDPKEPTTNPSIPDTNIITDPINNNNGGKDGNNNNSNGNNNPGLNGADNSNGNNNPGLNGADNSNGNNNYGLNGADNSNGNNNYGLDGADNSNGNNNYGLDGPDNYGLDSNNYNFNGDNDEGAWDFMPPFGFPFGSPFGNQPNGPLRNPFGDLFQYINQQQSRHMEDFNREFAELERQAGGPQEISIYERNGKRYVKTCETHESKPDDQNLPVNPKSLLTSATKRRR